MKLKMGWALLLALGLGACAQNNQPETKPAPQVNKQCEAALAMRLVGQDDWPDARIKEFTRAQTVRKVGPNQAVTADYRSERVTIVVDPATKKIIRAACG
ncbi:MULTISPECIES: I78 family peptidase inhibitor [Vitreoscilla]|uniref:Peptidase inhibitor I78 family protein n=1 Tax=Vitreoscilla stercoraria TaxID=61 RepID=A0ABY4E716_VITST|nr:MULTISPECIES: I78 family peptidase inhibitor [Vitreoscilla]AUZ04756.1 hypothetical protein ADP71_10760 [Vitreoscilla sp. C1]UOO91567.1 hypothetical protein LVJ81_07875 [Vitreoscilla stercoraria]